MFIYAVLRHPIAKLRGLRAIAVPLLWLGTSLNVGVSAQDIVPKTPAGSLGFTKSRGEGRSSHCFARLATHIR